MLEGNFVCTEGFTNYMVKGKVYKFSNGRCVAWEDGSKGINGYKNVQEFNERRECKIAPYSGNPKSLVEHLDTVIQKDGGEYVAVLKGKRKRFEDINGGKNDYDGFDDNLLWDGIEDRYQIMKIISPSGVIKWEREEKSLVQIEIEKIKEEMEKLTKRLEVLEAK